MIAVIGGIRGGIWGIGAFVEGMSNVLAVIGGVVGRTGADVWGFCGFIGGSDCKGSTDVVLGGPEISWFLSGWMKVSQVMASGPPSCLAVIRQLCRKLMGSSG